MPTKFSKLKPVDSLESLRSRVGRLFSSSDRVKDPHQFALPLLEEMRNELPVFSPTLGGFIDFLSASLPHGEVYLFGGVLRDLALLGRAGFNSDIDLVVEGDWRAITRYLDSCGATRNRFGGYRLTVGAWPIDIWNAEETWAIRHGFVEYKGIDSLTRTTVLNWDAILMNWRTKNFVCDSKYLFSLKNRALDIVLEANPNPLGMAVRVFRHLSLKDAKRISPAATEYLGRCTGRFSFNQLTCDELRSYGNSLIDPVLFEFFSCLREGTSSSIRQNFTNAVEIFEDRGLGISLRQLDLDF